MIRFILILTFFGVWHKVQCLDKIILAPNPNEPQCTSNVCDCDTDEKLDDLIQDVAQSCSCNACKKCKVEMDLYTFCEKYRNYDPETSGLVQCIQNRLTNVCYKIFYTRFRNILNGGCGRICQGDTFDSWQFFYDVCYGCNGCLDGCYIQRSSNPNILLKTGATAGTMAARAAR